MPTPLPSQAHLEAGACAQGFDDVRPRVRPVDARWRSRPLGATGRLARRHHKAAA